MIDRSNIKYYWDLEQGTDEWRNIRLGKFTGSDASVLFTNGKSESGISVGAMTLIYKNAAELITGDEGDSFSGNVHTERGNTCEPLAIDMYQEQSYNEVRKCGFIELNHYAGYSPDGLVGEDGIVENKAPDNKEYLRVYMERKVDMKYIAQMQFGMWLTGRKWCDNIYFNSNFAGTPMFYIRFLRDEAMMKMLDDKMLAIFKKMDEIQNKFHANN